MQNISIRKFLRIICAGTVLTAAAVLAVLYWLTRDSRIVLCGLILTAVFFMWGAVFLKYFQLKLSRFTDSLCRTLDGMMDGNERPHVDYEAETLLARISHRLGTAL